MRNATSMEKRVREAHFLTLEPDPASKSPIGVPTAGIPLTAAATETSDNATTPGHPHPNPTQGLDHAIPAPPCTTVLITKPRPTPLAVAPESRDHQLATVDPARNPAGGCSRPTVSTRALPLPDTTTPVDPAPSLNNTTGAGDIQMLTPSPPHDPHRRRPHRSGRNGHAPQRPDPSPPDSTLPTATATPPQPSRHRRRGPQPGAFFRGVPPTTGSAIRTSRSNGSSRPTLYHQRSLTVDHTALRQRRQERLSSANKTDGFRYSWLLWPLPRSRDQPAEP